MDNPFKKIFSSISHLSGNSGDNALGIDIGSSAIKVVEIKKKKGRAVLETYGSISLAALSSTEAGQVTNLPAEKIVAALQEVLKQSGVSTSAAGLAIPVQSSLIFTLELPASIKEGEMGGIIATEARKYIPVPITEVSLDWFILPQKELSFKEANDPDLPAGPEEKLRVLVIATQNETVSRYRAIASECALAVQFFEIEIFASARSNFEHELSLTLLADFGASRTKLALVEFGVVQSYHTIDRGGADISSSIATALSISFSEAEKMKKEFGLLGGAADKNLAEIIKTHTDYIFAEINNVLLSYEKKHNRAPNKVILTGGGALLKGLKETALSNFQVEVVIGQPFSKVQAPAFLDKVLSVTGPEFAVALGLALRQLQ